MKSLPVKFSDAFAFAFCMLVLLSMLLCPCISKAGETWADVSITSYHAGGNGSYNSNNFGLGLERDIGNKFAMVGRYKNSLGEPSRYVLAGVTPVHFLGADIGIVAGALDGYQTMRNGHAFFAAGGVMRWTGERVRAQLMLLPPIKGSVTHDADGGTWTRHATPAALGLMFCGKFQ